MDAPLVETPEQIRQHLQSYKQGAVTRAAMLRALVSYDGWCVPSQPAEGSAAGVRLVPGHGGLWWFMVFSDEQFLAYYDQCSGTDLALSHFVARGAKLARGMSGVAGVAYDFCTEHAVTIEGQELPLLQEFGKAMEVEAVLAGSAKVENPEETLLSYQGYRVQLASSPGGALLAPGPCGPEMLRVFTAEDAAEAFMVGQGGQASSLERMGGKELFEQLTIYCHDGILFNDIAGLPARTLSLEVVESLRQGGKLPATGGACGDQQASAAAGVSATDQAPPCPRCARPRTLDTDWCLQCGQVMRENQQPLPIPGAEELGPIYPIIQRHDWPGRGSQVHRSVCFLPRIPGTPWLSFGWDMGSIKAYVGQETLAKLGITAEQVEEYAVANLSRVPGSWEVVVPPSAKPEDGFFLACKDAKACERILEKNFMRHAQRMLGCDMVAVTMAAQNGLVVGSMAMAETLMLMANHVFEQMGEAALTPWCIAVADGQVRGRFFEENGQLGLDAVM